MVPYENDGVSISETNALFTIWTHSNLQVQWNFTDEILIGVPITQESRVCGLCKNFESHYSHGKYPLLQRDAAGQETCFAIFEDTRVMSCSDSIFTTCFAKILQLLVASVLILCNFHHAEYFCY